MSVPLKEILADYTMPAAPELVRDEGDGALRCLACANRCKIDDGKTGICRVRYNRGGELRVPAGYVAGLNIDPIEKKPFFHVLPGSDALSFGMLGCNFHCSFCQNWVSSQALKDDRAVSMPSQVNAQQILDLAVKHQVPIMTSTYNEPLITSDWSVEIFKRAKEHNILCGYVSNGNATPEVLGFLRPHMDLYKVDLKCYNDENYRQLGGKLQTVLDTISRLKQMGFWVEVVTLVVPGFNDGDQELTNIAKFLTGVSPDIPWHVTAFHPDYQMTGQPRTSPQTLFRAYQIGKTAGLNFVYAGNLPSQVENREDTFCPACNATLIRRQGFYIKENRLVDSKCPDCNTKIPGVWKS
ncbi:MAG: AmmeMemoRadiSam system radical SAM enzyme [Planctomycetota bacterium]|jgi:pyruvate formate lyase activating enzyme